MVAGSLIVATNDGFPWLGQSADVGQKCVIDGPCGAHVGGGVANLGRWQLPDAVKGIGGAPKANERGSSSDEIADMVGMTFEPPGLQAETAGDAEKIGIKIAAKVLIGYSSAATRLLSSC